MGNVSSALENLCGPGKPLKKEPPDTQEYQGLRRAGLARLADAANTANSLEGRFDLGYNAAHSLCLAALRRHGYRAVNRYIVFQVLPHTLAWGRRCGASWPSVMPSGISASMRATSASMSES